MEAWMDTAAIDGALDRQTELGILFSPQIKEKGRKLKSMLGMTLTPRATIPHIHLYSQLGLPDTVHNILGMLLHTLYPQLPEHHREIL